MPGGIPVVIRMNKRSVSCTALRLLACLLWWGVLVGWVASAGAQSQTPDRATYEAWLREANIAAQRRDRLGLEQIAPQLINTTAVEIADGVTVPVDNSWLREALDAPDPDLQSIAQRLGALVEAIAQPDSAAPDDAQERLRAILSRPPFATEPQREGLLIQFLDWFFRQLARLFDVDVGPTAGRPVLWLVTMLGGLLVLGMLVYLLVTMGRALVSEARTPEEHDPEAHLTANTALQQAGTLARGGDYRTAVRYLYLSSLLWLDERGLLRYDRALTNREYLDRLGDNVELRSRLAPIIDTFDRVWYGYAPLDAESFAAYQRQVNDLRKVRL